MRRVILILIDGLRPDAITPSIMPSLDAFAHNYTLALRASTVRPSTTVAALASLATGVGPANHRLVEPGLGFLGRLGGLRPVARELGKGGIPVDVVSGELAMGAWPIAHALASAAGVRKVVSGGRTPLDAATATNHILLEGEEQAVFVYLPDCDRAGHAYGWMSTEYLKAASAVDVAVGRLTGWVEDALVMVLADHGGGGVRPDDHDEPHEINDHIPLVIGGVGATRRHQLTRPVSILDVPATLLWWFSRPIPPTYEGRPLTEALSQPARPVEVLA